MANCIAALGYVASSTGCAPAAGTRTRIYVGNYSEVTLGAEGSGATLGKVATFTMASTKVLFAIDIYQDSGIFEEKYTQDSATWDTSGKGLIKSLAAAARNVFNDHAGAKLILFIPLKSGPIKIVGCDDGAFLANNDASSATGNVGEAFTYTAKNASKKALEYFHTDTATSLADLEDALTA